MATNALSAWVARSSVTNILIHKVDHCLSRRWIFTMMTSSNRTLFRGTGRSPATGEFPSHRPVTRSFDVFFDLHRNKRFSKPWWGWWLKTPSRSLRRHCNGHRSKSMSRNDSKCNLFFKINSMTSVEYPHYMSQRAHKVDLSIDMMMSSNGSFFRVTGPLCGKFTGQRWISLTKGQ